MFDVGHLGAFEPVGLEDLHEIWIHQIASEPAGFTKPVALEALQDSPGVVIEHQHHRVDAVLSAGGQFLKVVLEPAVAGYADHWVIGLPDLCADCRGEREP